MKTAAQIHFEVMAELEWNPDVTSLEISANREDGVVGLSGPPARRAKAENIYQSSFRHGIWSNY